MNKIQIKGSCEYCGFAYKGTIESGQEIKCPHCKKETHNWDEASEVDANDKAEGYKYDYVESKFE